MGLFDRLRGLWGGSESKKEIRAGELPDDIRQYYFVGNELGNDPIKESIIILEYSRERDEWTIVRCNEPINVAPDTDAKLCVYRQGSLITRGDGGFQSNLAWFLSPSEIEALTEESWGDVVYTSPFPERLRGVTIPESSVWEREKLERLYLSLNIESEVYDS